MRSHDRIDSLHDLIGQRLAQLHGTHTEPHLKSEMACFSFAGKPLRRVLRYRRPPVRMYFYPSSFTPSSPYTKTFVSPCLSDMDLISLFNTKNLSRLAHLSRLDVLPLVCTHQAALRISVWFVQFVSHAAKLMRR